MLSVIISIIIDVIIIINVNISTNVIINVVITKRVLQNLGVNCEQRLVDLNDSHVTTNGLCEQSINTPLASQHTQKSKEIVQFCLKNHTTKEEMVIFWKIQNVAIILTKQLPRS